MMMMIMMGDNDDHHHHKKDVRTYGAGGDGRGSRRASGVARFMPRVASSHRPQNTSALRGAGGRPSSRSERTQEAKSKGDASPCTT
jgi:hypothetical protein